ncbi:uncharacterized protein GGS22DRAFT_182177 [Annulohypoxylon maeteangense]|uniref:uncharacterized protein n=1 Tax=Annulohypoxylon maeteangense TaxID=1927788 RepID=UPI0020083915|nr:uncharacterized protein GGS22DRAFT_182177 [Annulohypoxylon maeteangense]KAI0880659.1 hypothetical protein GGS22DRAFT_182177 [Annulohypoxylon maeteangense]
MATLAENSTSHLPYGTHYHVLQPISAIAAGRVAVYNYEGIRRCHRCLCLQKRPLAHQRKCAGLSDTNSFPCLARCGRAFSTPAAARKHALRCEGSRISQDRYGTYVCPICGVAGFSGSAVAKHVSDCRGKRSAVLKPYSAMRNLCCCDSCGGVFLRNGFRRHTCHVVGDPVWFGRQDGPPDLSTTYVRWCRKAGLTLGGVPGEMPDVVPDLTISVPSAAADEHNGSKPAEWLSVVEGDDEDMLSDAEGGDDEYAFSDEEEGQRREEDDVLDDGESGDENEELGNQPDGRAEGLLGAHRARMAVALQRARVTFDSLDPTPCEGLTWRHGYFPCPFGTVITSDTAYFRSSVRRGGVKQLQILPFCFRCASLRNKISSWVAEGKYTVGGVHLCRRRGCRKPVAALWHCKYHADQLTRINIRGEGRLGATRVVPPEYLADFARSCTARELVCRRWNAVRDAVLGAPGLSPVFFVDTESVYDYWRRAFVVCELAIRSASGELLLHTPVDHGLAQRQLRQRIRPHMFAKLARIYDFRDLSGRTHGMTPEQVTEALVRIGMKPSAFLVEWSLCGFDLNALRSTFDCSIFPTTALLGHRLWRDLGVPGSLALMPFFSSLFPHSYLNQDHHLASIDSEKLFLTVRSALAHFR